MVVMWFLIDFALNKNGFWPEDSMINLHANLETILVSLLGLSTSLVKNFYDLAIVSSLAGMTTDRFSAMHLCVAAVGDGFVGYLPVWSIVASQKSTQFEEKKNIR